MKEGKVRVISEERNFIRPYKMTLSLFFKPQLTELHRKEKEVSHLIKQMLSSLPLERIKTIYKKRTKTVFYVVFLNAVTDMILSESYLSGLNF